MKKRGFTLIELLAVIVVLAIIALIATPIVMNTIKKSQKGAAERSADNYIDAVETAVATAKLDGKDVLDGTYTIEGNGNLIGEGLPDGKLKIEMNGNKPTGGTITIKKGQVTTDSKMTVGSYEVAYNPTTKKYEASEKNADNNIVLCVKAPEVDLDNLNYGNKFTCELGDGEEKTFYVLETSGDSVSLIMNINIDANGKSSSQGVTTKWCNSSNASCIADSAKQTLIDSTTSWKKLSSSQLSLPSAEQLLIASRIISKGDAITDDIIGNAHLNDWLGENMCNEESCVYWTTTLIESSNGTAAWFVYPALQMSGGDSTSSYLGIRPVITIPKSQLG